MFAPEIKNHIEYLKGGTMTVSVETEKLIDQVFDRLRKIAPCGDDERRELWLRAERGRIEAFGNYEDALEWEEVSSYEEFEKWWKSEYPDEIVWFRLVTIEREDYRAVFLGRKLIYQSVIHSYNVRDRKEDEVEFFQWMLDAVETVLEELESGNYNRRVEEELSKTERVGVIARKSLWDIYPEWRRQYFENITPEEVEQFALLIQDQQENTPVGTCEEEMTAGKFYEYCKLGYIANTTVDISDIPAKELYSRNADGRDDGLGEIDPDSVEAFADWLQNRRRIGHPWEVLRGGNSSHISLHVMRSNTSAGQSPDYYLLLDGDSWSRSIETIKFYLALRRNGVAVFLYEAKGITDRLLERDLIGIVPSGVMPVYCEAYFPNYKILDYMNLPDEKAAEVIEKVIWLKESEVKLARK